ncbi:MAG: class I SAM-dependent methyltransferase [Nitrososphaerales archaeon]
MQPQTVMRPHTVAALLALNRQFYARFAGEFSRTRRSWPPGFSQILPYVRSGFNVLDLGCGNARFLVFLDESGWNGRYTGLDSSESLLEDARTTVVQRSHIPASFVLADLFADDWPGAVERAGPFDAVVTLAVLHHIPGRDHRVAFLAHCARLLPPGAPLVVSTWQFMTSERLKKRLVSWETVGIRAEDVEPGDHLVGWGEGSPGARYCASIDGPQLKAMAAEAGLTTWETFLSDGHEGNLNLYGVFARNVSAR